MLVQNAECLLRYIEKTGASGQEIYLFHKKPTKNKGIIKKKIFLQEKIFKNGRTTI